MQINIRHLASASGLLCLVHLGCLIVCWMSWGGCVFELEDQRVVCSFFGTIVANWIFFLSLALVGFADIFACAWCLKRSC